MIDLLVDSITKNGTMLLNVLQKPDGTLDEQTDWMLSELEKWFSINGEAVYGTRPWRVAGEGSSTVRIEGFREDKVSWQPDDFRFVQKDGKLYAYIMCPQVGKVAVIRSLTEGEHVSAVRLLGYGKVGVQQGGVALVVRLREQLPMLGDVDTLEGVF